MKIRWKSKFKPEIVLDRIEETRFVDSDGKMSFRNMDIQTYLPILESQLIFPPIAQGTDRSLLLWTAVAKVLPPLTPDSFIGEINRGLEKITNTKFRDYFLLTEISIEAQSIPRKITRNDVVINFYPNKFPQKFRDARNQLLASHKISVEETPQSYCKVVVAVKAKSVNQAFHSAMKELDTQRALWCLMNNLVMQFDFGGQSHRPINSVRLGSRHTLHFEDGSQATDTTWYEPNFRPASVLTLSNPKFELRHSNAAIKSMSNPGYGELLQSSLIKYVRALDECDPNSAFLRLWSAVEGLVTPSAANYDDLIRRCSFLFADYLFHQQELEHLRAYRNANIHAGEESINARTHCFQLQVYYRRLFWFYISQSNFFKDIKDANRFLDSPKDIESLQENLIMARKAIRFRTPKSP